MILDTVRATIKHNGLLDRNDTVIIGVSGGPDSLALLHILVSLKKELALSLHVAHLDHAIRTTSGEDCAFVARAARELQLPFTGKAIKLSRVSEEAARQERLKFLLEVARRQKAGTVALGHTLDDQAETVLMRLIRGSGLLGLSGIAPRREFDGIAVIRPLIETTRSEIERYLKKKRLKPRIDETNAQDIFLRNRIRRELLPLLEKKYNPNIKQVLSNTAGNAGYDYDFLVRSAEKAAGNAGRTITLARLSRMHPALRRLTLRLMAERVQGDLRRLTSRHIQEIEDMIRNRPAGSVVNLPKNVSARKTAKNLCFYRP